MNESQTAVTKEMWYQGQKAMSDTIKELSSDIKEVKADLRAVSKTSEETLVQATKTNGRATALEGWSSQAKLLIEKLINDTQSLKNDRVRIYTIISCIIVLGGSLGYIALKELVRNEVQSTIGQVVK